MPRKAKKQVELVEEAVQSAPAGSFVVYAEFDEYRAGDIFTKPDDWVIDEAYTELLLTKAKKRDGIVFLKPDGGRVTLPVKEA